MAWLSPISAAPATAHLGIVTERAAASAVARTDNAASFNLRRFVCCSIVGLLGRADGPRLKHFRTYAAERAAEKQFVVFLRCCTTTTDLRDGDTPQNYAPPTTGPRGPEGD